MEVKHMSFKQIITERWTKESFTSNAMQLPKYVVLYWISRKRLFLAKLDDLFIRGVTVMSDFHDAFQVGIKHLFE